jgi:hypothetical protein
MVGRWPSGEGAIRPAPVRHRLAGAVATADAVIPQQPHVAASRDGSIGDLRKAVGIGQTTRSQIGQEFFKPRRLEADQIEVETAEFEITQLGAEQIGVPA